MSRGQGMEHGFMGRFLISQLLGCLGQWLTKVEYAQRVERQISISKRENT